MVCVVLPREGVGVEKFFLFWKVPPFETRGEQTLSPRCRGNFAGMSRTAVSMSPTAIPDKATFPDFPVFLFFSRADRPLFRFFRRLLLSFCSMPGLILMFRIFYGLNMRGSGMTCVVRDGLGATHWVCSKSLTMCINKLCAFSGPPHKSALEVEPSHRRIEITSTVLKGRNFTGAAPGAPTCQHQ